MQGVFGRVFSPTEQRREAPMRGRLGPLPNQRSDPMDTSTVIALAALVIAAIKLGMDIVDRRK